MKNIGITVRGYEMNAHGIKRRNRKARTRQMVHTIIIVP